MSELDALVWIASSTEGILNFLKGEFFKFLKVWFIIWLIFAVWRGQRK